MAVEPLQGLRASVVDGALAVPEDARPATLARIDDLITAVDAGDRALARLPRPAVDEAAAKLAYVRYLTGHTWRTHVAGTAALADFSQAMDRAVRVAVADLVVLVERTIVGAEQAKVARHADAIFALPCAICGSDAVTLSREQVSPAAPVQLVVTSLSPVTVFRSIAGPRMRDVIALLEAGDAMAVVTHLRETHPGGCDAWCDACARVYCKQHYAIEAQWSGSWHEATYATCTLGHEHTID